MDPETKKPCVAETSPVLVCDPGGYARHFANHLTDLTCCQPGMTNANMKFVTVKALYEEKGEQKLEQGEFIEVIEVEVAKLHEKLQGMSNLLCTLSCAERCWRTEYGAQEVCLSVSLHCRVGRADCRAGLCCRRPVGTFREWVRHRAADRCRETIRLRYATSTVRNTLFAGIQGCSSKSIFDGVRRG